MAGKENIEKVMIHYSVGNGYYFTMAGKAVLDQHFLDNVKTRMQELADMCTPIEKRSVNTDDAVSLFIIIECMTKKNCFVSVGYPR